LVVDVACGNCGKIILIIKASKTNPREVIGTNKYCRKCGIVTKGLACPKCERKSQSFGV